MALIKYTPDNSRTANKNECTLRVNRNKAKSIIYRSFDKAVELYNGKCTAAPPTEQAMMDKDKGMLFFVCDMMVIAVYAVAEDMPAFYSNKKLYERVEQSGANVDKIFSIAAGYESAGLEEFLADDVDDEFYSELFPEAPAEEIAAAIAEREPVASVLLHYGYYGFIVTLLIPKRDNFIFKEEGSDEYRSCRVRQIYWHLRYVYLEDMSLLAAESERVGKECLAMDIKDFRENQKLQHNGTN